MSRQILKVELQSESDRFLLDNEIVVPLPEARPILAAWIRPDEVEDPYTRLALAAIQESGRFELLKGSPEAWPLSEEVDAIIFDGWLPEEWPQTIPAIVINPPASSGPIISKRLSSPIPFDEIRVGNAKHPLLYRISTGRIALTQTVLFETTNTLEPLWFAGDETILAAGEVKGQRLILMGFSPGLSERLPLTASFPLLIGNALLWCVEETSERVMPPLYASGDLVEVEGTSVDWLEARSAGLRNREIPLYSNVLIMDRPGYWETDSGQKGASFLLSPSETNLPVKNPIANEISFAEERTGTASLKSLLLVTLLIILFAEYWLLHRFAVY